MLINAICYMLKLASKSSCYIGHIQTNINRVVDNQHFNFTVTILLWQPKDS